MISAIILAAGTSSRMGQPKQVLPLDGEPLLERVLNAVRASRVSQTVVVLGHAADRVRKEVDLTGTAVIVNDGYDAGMSSSIRTGLQAVDPDAEAVFVVLGDQPLLSSRTLDALVAARDGSDATIFVPTYRGVRGNPVLLDRRLAHEMETLTGDVGCRGLFHRHPDGVREVPVEDPGVLLDLDTEADFERVQRALREGEEIPSLVLEMADGGERDRDAPFLPPRLDVPSRAEELRARGEPFALATVVRAVAPSSGKPGFKALVHADGRMEGWVGGGCSRHLVVSEALEALRTGEPRLVRFSNQGGPAEGIVQHPMECESDGAMDVFVEPHRPRPQLLLVGDSPVVAVLCALGGLLGYRVVVAAPGGAKEDHPEADGFLSDLEGLAEAARPETYAVVASMGRYDQTALEQLVRAGVRYLALVASQRRARATREALQERGVPEDALGAIRNPAGLDLGAETQEEIALSIMAEIVHVRRSSEARTAAVGTAADEAHETDPVCGMMVSPDSPLRAEHEETVYHFCSEGCRDRFQEAPEDYVA